MRYALVAAPLVAAVLAQDTTSTQSYTLVPEISNGKTVTSTYTYSNLETNFLTETNSAGVVTGMPSNTATHGINTQHAVTTQPPVATIPAGITGTTQIYLNVSGTLTSFTVVGGKSTTSVFGAAASDISTVAGSSTMGSGNGGSMTGSSSPSKTHGSGNGNGGSGNGGSASGTKTGSSSSSTSSNAAVSNVQIASAGMLGLGALFAALL